jgi:hypothetical protein
MIKINIKKSNKYLMIEKISYPNIRAYALQSRTPYAQEENSGLRKFRSNGGIFGS